MCRFLAAITVILFASLGSSQPPKDDLTVLRPGPEDVPPRKMLYRYLQAQAQKHFDARRAEVARLETPEQVRHRQQILRAKFIEALGGFPERTPLNPKIVGKEQRDGYRIEKVIYESRPQHHVTATLYLPDGKGPFPGVLMPIGHSANGKAADYVQKGSILLAQNGLAVLAYDPIGQGERRQLLDHQRKGLTIGSTTEHTLVGVGALLIGQNTATYRIWDGLRSLDYLASRPEIDASRLGCTGCSGGGTLTSYLMALDDRILAAAPSCYITSLERLFATIGPQDAEQNITGQVAFGLEHADYLTLRAPRPTLICAATQDFFDIGGTWTTFREATRIYGILGHSERVAMVEYNTKHGFPKPQREAVVRWMRRWLLHKDDAPVEGDITTVKDQQLWCTRTGQVLEDLRGKSVFDFNQERATELAKQRGKLSAEERKKEVRRLIALPEKIPAPKVRSLSDQKRKNYALLPLIFETEPGIQVPAVFFLPDKPAPGRPLLVYLQGRGMAADLGPGGVVEKLVQAGNHVVTLDVRGFGETAPGVISAKSSGLFGVDFQESFLALHLNRPLLGQRVFDLLAVTAYMEGMKVDTRTGGVRLLASGAAVPVALHAAALDERFTEVILEDGLISWDAVVRSPINYNQLTNVVPGALKSYDLPELAALVAPRPLTIRGAVDPKGEPVAQTVLEETHAVTRASYERHQAGERLVLKADR